MEFSLQELKQSAKEIRPLRPVQEAMLTFFQAGQLKENLKALSGFKT